MARMIGDTMSDEPVFNIYLNIGIEKGEIKWGTITPPSIMFPKVWEVGCHSIAFLKSHITKLIYLGQGVLFYCGTPDAFHITIYYKTHTMS